MNTACTPQEPGMLIDTLGSYALWRMNDSYFQLHGSAGDFPTAWVMAHLPEGPQWYTEWSGDHTELIVHIFAG